MKVVLLLCLGLALAASAPGKTKPLPKRHIVEAENDPYRIKYLAYKTKDGRMRVENLLRKAVLPKATADDVTFRLFTPNNPNSGEFLNCNNFAELLASPNFNPALDNYFITHGWTSSADGDLNHIIKDAILSGNQANVFVVDWSGPAGEFYTEARAAVPEIGLFIGHYINEMISNFGLSAANFRMAGHSLGAHVSGCAGAVVNGDVHYIIGMDPAGPLFSLEDTASRIDETDAAFVEIIHTNTALLGFESSIGHADFRPNGGDWQPGCGIDITGSCSHGRSYEFLGESIRSSGFLAVRCSSYDEFESGACSGNPTTNMGTYEVDSSAFGDYYLNTNGDPPYAQN